MKVPALNQFFAKKTYRLKEKAAQNAKIRQNVANFGH